MTDLTTLFAPKNINAIWKELKRSQVPIVDNETFADAKTFSEKIIADIKGNKYVPDIGHGYLGFAKSQGCTRFVPVLTKEDMAVYYSLTLSLQEKILKEKEGVFGGWLSVPKTLKKGEVDVIDPYFSNTINAKAWFQNWQSLTEMLVAISKDASVGNYVITTDIANFYDSIDVNRLVRRLRSEVGEGGQIIDILEHFLGYWDRRIKGYPMSTKGIPQEIISDASRTLSHFYLQEIDDEFATYTYSHGLKYIRWADDFIVFGSSEKKLEQSIHYLSKTMMKVGLNLNAAKTKIYSKSDYMRYRGIGVLSEISSKDEKKLERAVRYFDKTAASLDAREDTVVKSVISFLSSNKKAKSLYLRNYVNESLKKYKIAAGVNPSQLRKWIEISDDGKQSLEDHEKLVLRFPYAAPRAEYLRFLSKHYSALKKIGLTDKRILGGITKVENKSSDSDILVNICGPVARKRVEAQI